MEIVDVCDDVVPDDRRGPSVLRYDPPRDRRVEELVQRRDPGGVRHRRDVASRLHAEDAGTHAVERTKHCPVVAADLDGETAGGHETLLHLVGVRGEVRRDGF